MKQWSSDPTINSLPTTGVWRDPSLVWGFSASLSFQFAGLKVKIIPLLSKISHLMYTICSLPNEFIHIAIPVFFYLLNPDTNLVFAHRIDN